MSRLMVTVSARRALLIAFTYCICLVVPMLMLCKCLW